MPATTERRTGNDTPRSIALSRHRSPLRRAADALRRRGGGRAGRWPWVFLAGGAALAFLVLL